MERNNRKVYTGTVVSTKIDKTYGNSSIICNKTFPFSRNR